MKTPVINLSVSIVILNVCLCHTISGQKEFGFSMPPKVRRIEIPFDELNNLIVIPVTVNNSLKLKFILDTGVETAILTEKLYADLINANYLRELKIAGPGIADSVLVYVINDLSFELAGGLKGKNMSMIVLKENYLKLSESMGEKVHGIIGYDLFRRFIVEINYDSNKVTLYDPKKYRPRKKYTGFPIKIKATKPYLKTSITQKQNKKVMDVMIDTGASHAALLDFSPEGNIKIPEKRIITRLGTGIAGEIPGYLSRLDKLSIGEYSFNSVLFAFPFEGAYNKYIKKGSQHGTIGGDILHHFNVVIDYPNERIYLKKSSRYKDAFEYNMSGLTIIAKGEQLNTIQVKEVKKGSPAHKAGLRNEDIILAINSRNLYNSSLSEISALLRKREGMKIKCTVLREGIKFRTHFYLKRLI